MNGRHLAATRRLRKPLQTATSAYADLPTKTRLRWMAWKLIGVVASPVALLGLLALRLSARRVGVALIYHAVAKVGGDPSTELVPAHSAHLFERQMRHLRRRYRIIPAAQLLDAVSRRTRGQRFPVAVTFDDDLACHANVTLPILQRLRLPATFFLCGASIEAPFSFWWERLQRAVDQGLTEVSELVAISDPSARWKTIDDLARIIEEMEPNKRDAVAERLASMLGPDPEAAGMRAEDIQALLSAGMGIGFHTLRHYRLPPLPDAELERAMVEGKAGIERVVGTQLTLLSYPHGRADERVAAKAREHGFELAFTGHRSPVGVESNPLLLGRLGPSYWSRGHFALQMFLTLLGRTDSSRDARKSRPASRTSPVRS
jgi:peptidoglycan/xylan/chitin deacetylase (PgdA/CDA1 family)